MCSSDLALRLFESGPWQAKQLSARMGRTSRLKPTFGSAAFVVSAAVKMNAPATCRTPARRTNRRMFHSVIMQMFKQGADDWRNRQLQTHVNGVKRVYENCSGDASGRARLEFALRRCLRAMSYPPALQSLAARGNRPPPFRLRMIESAVLTSADCSDLSRRSSSEVFLSPGRWSSRVSGTGRRFLEAH